MKILISKILEGGIDLQTMEPEPKSLLLEHGNQCATLPISDEQFTVILSLLGSGTNAAVEEVQPSAAPEPPQMTPVNKNGDSFPVGKNGIQFDPSEDDPAIGETYPEDDYSDPETGVSAF